MNNKNTFLKVVASILLATTFNASLFAQQHLFDGYELNGVHAAMDVYFDGTSNSDHIDAPVYYKSYRFAFLSFGMNYVVLQKKNTNLKIGIRATMLAYASFLDVTNEQTPAEYGFVKAIGRESSGFIKYGIPITYEYVLKTKRKSKVALVLVALPSYWKKREVRSSWTFFETINERYLLKGNAVGDRLYFDAQIGISYYIPTRYVLIQPFVYYNKSFRDIWEGEYRISGIQNRPYTQVNGVLKQSGDHVSFGFNLYLKKSKKRLAREKAKENK